MEKRQWPWCENPQCYCSKSVATKNIMINIEIEKLTGWERDESVLFLAVASKNQRWYAVGSRKRADQDGSVVEKHASLF